MNCSGEKTQKGMGFGCDPARFQEMFKKMAECCPPECKTVMESLMGKCGSERRQETDAAPRKQDTNST